MASKEITAGRAFLRLLVDDKEFKKGLDASVAKLDSFGKSAIKVGATVGAAGAAITAPFVASLKVFSDVGDQLDKMALRTGLSVEALSELKFAAEQSGTNLESIERAAQAMARNLLNAEAGTGAAAEALDRLGLSLSQLKGQSPEQQFDAITRALAGIPDPTERAGLAMRIFGRSGTAIIPMISDMEKLRKQAQDLGLTMSTDAAKSAARLNDAFNALKLQGQAIAVAIGEALAPAVSSAAEGIAVATKTVIDFIRENKVLIQIAASVGATLTALGVVLATLGTIARATAVGIGLLRAALTLLAKHPYAIAITLALTAVAAIAAKFLDFGDSVDEATDSTDNHAASQGRLAGAMTKGTAAVSDRAKALAELSAQERIWLGLAEKREAREKAAANVRELRVKAIDEDIRASQETRGAFAESLAETQRRRRQVAAESGPRREQALSGLDNRIAELQGEIAAWNDRIARLQTQRDELSGDADKRRQEEIAARKRQQEEAQAERARRLEELAKAQEEARERAREVARRRQEQARDLAESIQSQVAAASRSLRTGFGGQNIEQIAGTTAAQSTESRMLSLTEEQVGLLGEVKTLLSRGPVLRFGET